MIRNGLIAATAFLLLSPVAATAAGYGAAGCGLGSEVMGSEPGAKQVLAATTNGTSGNQTFGITSGTSNCGDHGLISLNKEREVFAQQNYTSLVKEMAQGKGETLSTLANLYQCPGSTHQEFGAMTQSKFDQLISNDQVTSAELLAKLENQINDNPKLAKSCNIRISSLN